MLTAIARAARLAGQPLNILTARPEVWRGNHDPLSLQADIERWHYAKRRGWITTEIVHLLYPTGAPGHIAAQMAKCAGVALPPDWRPVLNLPKALPRHPRRLVLQNSCRGALYAADTKEWPQSRWNQLVRRLAGDFELVQIGTLADPPLAGAIDRRGRTNLAEAAALIQRAACFVGLESGLMHVAAAVRAPSVIIYGGRTRPHETGYAHHANLTRNPACAGCALNTGCPHSMVCMEIPVDEVEAAVRQQITGQKPS
jgi:ADP-heptose:LPS heptosyltransferase